MGYRYELPNETLAARFTDASKLELSTLDIPTKTENAPIVGESTILTLEELKMRRMQEVAFLLAKLTLEKYFLDDDGNAKPWLFPKLLAFHVERRRSGEEFITNGRNRKHIGIRSCRFIRETFRR